MTVSARDEASLSNQPRHLYAFLGDKQGAVTAQSKPSTSHIKYLTR